MTDERKLPCPACCTLLPAERSRFLSEELSLTYGERDRLRSKLANVRKLLTQPDTRSSMQVTMALCEIDGIE